MSSPWLVLLLAGLLEVVWALGLKFSNGFTRLVPSLVTVGALGGSMALLGLATRHLPLGTAYAVWVGIGAAGAAIGGIMLFGETANPARLGFLALLVVSIVGLKLTSS